MELLIPGLILVALMVYASTKIKKTAAAAFEAETIETDEFLLEKPEGFLNVLNLDPALVLDAYSREFGVEPAADIRQARIQIRQYRVCKMSEAVALIAERSKVKSDISELVGERKYRLIEAERIEKGICFREIYKLSEKDEDVFELKVIALEDTNEDLLRKIDQIVLSFVVK